MGPSAHGLCQTLRSTVDAFAPAMLQQTAALCVLMLQGRLDLDLPDTLQWFLYGVQRLPDAEGGQGAAP